MIDHPCYITVVLLLTAVNKYTAYFHIFPTYSGADKSLARPGNKQATATEDFDFHVSYL